MDSWNILQSVGGGGGVDLVQVCLVWAKNEVKWHEVTAALRTSAEELLHFLWADDVSVIPLQAQF